MDLPPVGHTPTQSVTDVVGLARSIFVARGILWRSMTLLVANEPKPWSNRLRSIRGEMAKSHGILSNAWEHFDGETKSAAIRSEVQATNKVASNRTRRTSGSSE